MPHIVLLGTLDTKLEEFRYIHEQLTNSPLLSSDSKVRVTLIDCGKSQIKDDCIAVTHDDLTSKYGSNKSIQDMPRGDVIKFMTECAKQCVQDLIENDHVHGILSAGGSGGSTLAAEIMKAAPMGLPKLLVSTIASGDVGPLVGETDTTLMHSIVDIAGSNALLHAVLGNAAAAMVGMAARYEAREARTASGSDKPCPRVGVTMFGVTTPGVDRIRARLSGAGAEVYVFHATGTGGRAMERLVREGRLDAVLDLTTTELCDELLGGVMSAGPQRLEAALRCGLPTIVSVGATDMVNFGPRESVPERYRDRKLLEHNANVTLMRTSKEDCEAVGRAMVGKIRGAARETARVQVWLPKGGVSMISVRDGPFADAAADGALFRSLKTGLEGTGVKVVEDARDINDAGFADAVAEAMIKLMQESGLQI